MPIPVKVRLCRWPGCEIAVSGDHLCCVSHYRSLPGRIQAGIQERIRGWKDRAAAETFLSSYFAVTKMKGREL
jgi:hypothetical protein